MVFRSLAAAGAALVVAACALAPVPAGRPAAVLPASLAEIMPHGDGDHFVYIFEKTAGAGGVEKGIQVEHVRVTGGPGEFEVALSESGLPIGLARYRETAEGIAVISEDDLHGGVRLSFDPPLLFVPSPLTAGEHRSAGTATLTRLAGDEKVGAVQVTQVTAAAAAPPGTEGAGDWEGAVVLRTARTMRGAGMDIILTVETVVAPGVGEVRSEGQVKGAFTLRRELACGFVGGRRIGDCSDLAARIERRR